MRQVTLGLACAMTVLLATPAGAQIAGGGRGGGGPAGPTSAVNGGGPPAVVAMPTGGGAISGIVTDGNSGQPLPNTVVVLSLQTRDGNGRLGPASQLVEATDSKGRFVFTDLPAADRYALGATHFAYFDGGYGRRPDRDVPARIVLADNEWFSRANIELWRTGVIAGLVTDERGDPVVGAYVRVLRRLAIAGAPQLAVGPIATTDDRGAYRISGLNPGTYFVNVPAVQSSIPSTAPITANEPAVDGEGQSRRVVGRYPTPAGGAARSVYASAFHPGGSSFAQAEAITLEYGSDRTDVDVRIDPVPSFRVSGRVEGPVDVASKLVLRLMAQGTEELSVGSEAATTLVAADGTFTFLDVPAGDYTLEGRGTITEYQLDSIGISRLPESPGLQVGTTTAANVPNAPSGVSLRATGSSAGDRYWGRMPLHVAGRDLSTVTLTLHPSVMLSGTVVFEGATPPPSFLLITAESADGLPSEGLLQNRTPPQNGPGTFHIEGLLASEYFLRARGGDTWTVKSIMSGGKDYAAKPFDGASGHDFTDVVLTLTDKGGAIAGAVRADAATPIDTAAVIVFPVDRAGWSHFGFAPDRLKSTPVTNAGSFQISGLPAGDYNVVAVDRNRLLGWQDPAFLEAAAKIAARVTVGWGETKSVELAVSTIR